MTEELIHFRSGELELEGRVQLFPGVRGLIMTHPHPLYGGNMYNPVVEAVLSGFQAKSYSTMRFNFRGVSGSEGIYADGIGEQEDVLAALQYFSGLGKTSIDLGGYSFGSWVNARGLKTFRQVNRLIMVSPPVDRMNFDFLTYDPRIQLIIGAEQDEIAPVNQIAAMLPNWNPQADFQILQGTDHFYGGRTAEIQRIIAKFLSEES